MSTGVAARLRIAVIVASVGWAIVIAWVFASRVGFALELEWMEGGVLHQARRLQEGLPIYPPPSIDFVPFLYTPLYAIVLAALGSIVPLGYVLARVVSIAATIAIAAAIWTAVRDADRPRAHAALGVGLFLSGYVFTFRWLDVGRPDSLFMALTLWGLVWLRRVGLTTERRSARRRAIAAGVLVALAFWTKQTAATFVIGSGLGALVVAPRQLWIYALTIAAIDGGGVLVGNAMTDGWLWTYIYELHQAHAFNRERFTTKTWGMFLHAAPLLVLAVALRLGMLVDDVRRRRRAGDPIVPPDAWRTPLFWWLFAATGLLVSALGYATQWAEPNAFIPGVTLGAVAIATSIPTSPRRESLMLILALAQMIFALLVEPMYQPIQDRGRAGIRDSYAWQDIGRTVPSSDHRARAEALREQIEATEGELLALHRPWWSVLAGGDGHVGSMGINDIAPEDQKRLRTQLRQSIRERRWSTIWFEGEPPKWLQLDLRTAGYRVTQRLRGDDRVRPWSGWMSVAGVVTPYEQPQVRLDRTPR